jgi:opacity protein-like surface antigen
MDSLRAILTLTLEPAPRQCRPNNVDKEIPMRRSVTTAILTLLTAARVFAQDSTPSVVERPTKGYITAVGGLSYFANIENFATGGHQATGLVGADIAVRIVPHVLVFGDGGWIPNFQKGLQPILISTTNSLFNDHSISSTGTGTLRMFYGVGGVNIAGPRLGQFTPYVLGGVGLTRLTSTSHFTYHSGTIPGQTTAPASGADITAALASAKLFTEPAPSSPAMFLAGGGVQLALAQHTLLDVEYRYSRIAADAALTAPAMGFSAFTFGAGYRF